MSICVLCNEDGGRIIYKNNLFRIIAPDEILYPGFVRLILNSHYKEMTDLKVDDTKYIFEALLKIEKSLRKHLNPDKINLASFGNVVPHLHWHIIPRFFNDTHYPNPIWGQVTNPKYNPSHELCNQVEAFYISLASEFQD